MSTQIETQDKKGTLLDHVLLDQRDVERLFVAAVFIAPENALETCGFLDPKDISHVGIRRFWEILRDRGPAYKIEAATESGVFDLVTDPTVLVHSYDVDQYARTISKHAFLFRVGDELGRLAQAVADRRVELVRHMVDQLAADGPALPLPGVTAADALLELFDLYDNPGDRIFGTGLDVFDLATGGLERETYNIFAARPGTGKTTLILQFCENLAGAGRRVLLASQEMSKTQLFGKMATGRAGLKWRKVLQGQITPDERRALENATSELMEKLADNLIVIDTPNLTTFDLWDAVARLKPDVLFQDHLSLLGDKGEKEVYRQGFISGRGKAIAKFFGIPVVFVHQLRREADGQEPTLSDLRDSGKHEEHADNVYMIHRDDYAAGRVSDRWSETKVLIRKSRMDVANGVVFLRFDTKYQRFDRTV